MIKVFLFSKEQ